MPPKVNSVKKMFKFLCENLKLYQLPNLNTSSTESTEGHTEKDTISFLPYKSDRWQQTVIEYPKALVEKLSEHIKERLIEKVDIARMEQEFGQSVREQPHRGSELSEYLSKGQGVEIENQVPKLNITDTFGSQRNLKIDESGGEDPGRMTQAAEISFRQKSKNLYLENEEQLEGNVENASNNLYSEEESRSSAKDVSNNLDSQTARFVSHRESALFRGNQSKREEQDHKEDLDNNEPKSSLQMGALRYLETLRFQNFIENQNKKIKELAAQNQTLKKELAEKEKTIEGEGKLHALLRIKDERIERLEESVFVLEQKLGWSRTRNKELKKEVSDLEQKLTQAADPKKLNKNGKIREFEINVNGEAYQSVGEDHSADDGGGGTLELSEAQATEDWSFLHSLRAEGLGEGPNDNNENLRSELLGTNRGSNDRQDILLSIEKKSKFESSVSGDFVKKVALKASGGGGGDTQGPGALFRSQIIESSTKKATDPVDGEEPKVNPFMSSLRRKTEDVQKELNFSELFSENASKI